MEMDARQQQLMDYLTSKLTAAESIINALNEKLRNEQVSFRAFG
jgi:hypothetical protein